MIAPGPNRSFLIIGFPPTSPIHFPERRRPSIQREDEGARGMGQVKVRLGDSMKTSLVTLYLKALDARRTPSVLGDTMAAQAVEKIGYDFARLKMSPKVAPHAASRAKHLDDWTSEFLANTSGPPWCTWAPDWIHACGELIPVRA
jgi:hypothetical protein